MDAEVINGSAWSDYWSSLTGGLEFHVRQTPFDVLLVTLSLGTVLILLILYSTYLLVRRLRTTRPYRTASKADRPLWILALISSGSAWIVGVLLYSGSLTVSPESTSSCAIIRHVGMYLAGFTLWLCLVLYKLIRKFYQFRVVKYKPPHALAVVAALWTPFVLLTIIAGVFSESNRTSQGTCAVMWQWMLPTFALLAVYGVLFIFLMAKIRRTIGEHHQTIRYSIFLSTSFAFPLFDGVALFVQIPEYPNLMGQILVLVTLVLVLANMTHLFVLVLRGKRHRAILPAGGVDGVFGLQNNPSPAAPPEMLSLSSLSSMEAGERNAALDDINSLLAEGFLEPPPSSGPASQKTSIPPMFRRPRRSLEEEMAVDFEEFIQRLPDQLAAKVDRNRGFFVHKS